MGLAAVVGTTSCLINARCRARLVLDAARIAMTVGVGTAGRRVESRARVGTVVGRKGCSVVVSEWVPE
eukprot:scaffold66010_cov54-Attheya_sp.AAC.2